MTVRSRDDDQPVERRRGPAIISRARLARQQTAFEQAAAWFLLFLSLAGSVLAGGGGLAAWSSWSPNWYAAGAAGALQLGCTWVQWMYAIDSWRSWRYLVAVAISSALTIAGYGPAVYGTIAGGLTWAQVPAGTIPYATWVLIGLAAGLLDVFPERTLTH